MNRAADSSKFESCGREATWFPVGKQTLAGLEKIRRNDERMFWIGINPSTKAPSLYGLSTFVDGLNIHTALEA